MLDPLAEAENGSEYDQLLATYLLSKGGSLEELHFHPEAVTGQPLVFTLTLPQQAAKQ